MDHQTVQANGLRFAYLEQGTGPLVLLVHGFPDTAHTWADVMPAIAAAGYRAVAPFTRGYAPTEIPDGPFDTETLARDLLALIDVLGDGSPAVVVGHDWGASAAYAAAGLAPAKLRLLVTLAIPHPGGLRPTPKLVWTLRHFFRLRTSRAGALLAANDFAYVDLLWRRWSPAWRDLPASETAHVKQAFADPACAVAACRYYRDAGTKVPPSQRVKLEVPAVAFAGTDDMIAPRAYEKVRHMFARSYEVVQVPGGHFMHREHPATFREELLRVLRDKAAITSS